MRKMMLMLNCGTGTDSADAYLVSEQDYQDWKSNKFPCALSTYAWDMAVDHAAMYGIYPMSEQPEDFDEDNGDCWSRDEYSDDIDGHWEEYNPDEHDGLMVGPQTEWDWREL